jgi:hypothetical protein
VKMIVEKQMERRLAGETEVLGENLPPATFVHHKIPHDQNRVWNPGRRSGKPATNFLSYVTSHDHPMYCCIQHQLFSLSVCACVYTSRQVHYEMLHVTCMAHTSSIHCEILRISCRTHGEKTNAYGVLVESQKKRDH